MLQLKPLEVLFKFSGSVMEETYLGSGKLTISFPPSPLNVKELPGITLNSTDVKLALVFSTAPVLRFAKVFKQLDICKPFIFGRITIKNLNICDVK